MNPGLPAAPSLFDGETNGRAVPAVRERLPEPEPAPMNFGTRSLLVAAVLAQAGVVGLLLPRMVLVLDAISTNPQPLVPLAALGALGVGLFGWAWWTRPRGVAIAYCVVAAVWWIYFFAQSF